MSRALGPTSGSQEGNVRAIIAVAAMVMLHIFLFFLAWLVTIEGYVEYKDVFTALTSAITALDVGAVSYYVGVRSGEAR